MSHPKDTCYHILLAIHPTTGVILQTALDASPANYTVQEADTQEQKYLAVDCQSPDALDVSLNGYIDTSYDPYIVDICGPNPENISLSLAKLLRRTYGDSGMAWNSVVI